MGCRPASQVQQTAFHTAMNNHMPKMHRHRIALHADDMAAGANTLEELFEIYKALVITLHKAGIQIKASKVEFGVEEVTFHNYKVVGGDGPMSNITTTTKDENLDPIKSCSKPQTDKGAVRSNTTNVAVCTLLRLSRSTPAQTHQKGYTLSNWE
jgi:hypothetical protein